MTEDTPTAEGDGSPSLADDEINERILAEHRSIPEENRAAALERDNHRCQIDGYRAPDAEGSSRLVVRRMSDHPPDCGPDELANLTTCCLRCARWVERMPLRDDLPPALQRCINGVELKSNRVEILRYLHDEGPASTGDIAAHVSGLSSNLSVRCALYDLMRMHRKHNDIEGPLVRKNALSDEYGLPWQVPDRVDGSGRIPLDPKTRQIRILDAVVARMTDALDSHVENPKQLAAAVVAREPGSLDNMQRRHEALQFPFDTWAEANRSPYSDLAVVEAVDVLARATDNVSPRRAAEVIVKLFDRNSEQDLADRLREYYIDETEQLPLSDHRDHCTTDTDSDEQQAADHVVEKSEESAAATELHVINEFDTDGRGGDTTVGSVTENTNGE